MGEPVVTWNLFLTAVLVPLGIVLLGAVVKGFISRGFSQFQKGWDKFEEERERNRAERERELLEWRGDVAKSLTLLTTKLPRLITQDECDDMHQDIFGRLDNHGNRITALETRCDVQKELNKK